MANNNILKITKKIEVSKPILWFTWFILFVLPSIFAIVGYNYFKKEYIYFSKTDYINQAFHIIRAYNELIAPENFMSEQLKEIKSISRLDSPEAIKNQIDNYLCGKTLFCMFFNNTADKVTISKSNKIKNLTVNFLKKHISSLIKSYSESEHTKKTENVITSQQSLANALQVLFKTVIPITISKDKISKNFSVIYDGELYFIFAKFENSNNDYSYFFAVMKGEDFYFRKMLQKLNKRFPTIRIVFKEIDINRTLTEEKNAKELIIHSGIKQEKNNLFIICPASLIFSRHVLHNGKALLDKRFGNLIPFIEYRIPINETINEINKIEKLLNYILLTIIIISSIYFLHINFFGFNPNMKFKTKMLILTLFASLFPFAVFSIGFYSIELFNRFITKLSIQHRAEVELYFVSQKLNHYLTEIEDKMNQFGMDLNKYYNDNNNENNIKASEITEKLSSIAKDIPLSKEILYLDPVPNSLKELTSSDNPNAIIMSFPSRSSNELLDEQNDRLVNNVPSRIIELANEKSITREQSNYFYIGNEKVESDEMGYIFQNEGELLPLNQLVTTIWYEIQKIQKKETNELSGVYMAKFESRPILSFFFTNSRLAPKSFTETIDNNFRIDYAFIPIEKSGTASIWKGRGIISDEDRKLCLKNPKTDVINLDNKILVKKLNQRVPHLAVATITELTPFNEKRFLGTILTIIILYLCLIFIFTNKLIDIIFIEPVMILASNAIAIAKGSEEWNAEIKSGDQFEDLNNQFKNLVTGLRERNILKSYVSEDAFTDIQESETIKLSPGGEHMEATIVFSALKDYDKLSQQLTPQESIELLSRFMSIAEKVAKKYGGSIDKIIGDTIMFVFRDNPTLTSHGLRAAQTTLELVDKAKSANMPELYTGIASGKVISGRIGSYSGKLDFTVIGNPVNLAARFKTESKNGTEQTGIIISGKTIGLTKGKAIVRFLRRVAVKGKSHQYNIYELLGMRE